MSPASAASSSLTSLRNSSFSRHPPIVQQPFPKYLRTKEVTELAVHKQGFLKRTGSALKRVAAHFLNPKNQKSFSHLEIHKAAKRFRSETALEIITTDFTPQPPKLFPIQQSVADNFSPQLPSFEDFGRIGSMMSSAQMTSIYSQRLRDVPIYQNVYPQAALHHDDPSLSMTHSSSFCPPHVLSQSLRDDVLSPMDVNSQRKMYIDGQKRFNALKYEIPHQHIDPRLEMYQRFNLSVNDLEEYQDGLSSQPNEADRFLSSFIRTMPPEAAALTVDIQNQRQVLQAQQLERRQPTDFERFLTEGNMIFS